MGRSSGAYELNHEWGKSSATIFYWINKTWFVSFFVYKRQSLDHFRIMILTFSILYCQVYSSHNFTEQKRLKEIEEKGKEKAD